ncbi:large ribosomal subunit protein eL14z-like [Bidens hawaiensis]|uniref:large ribosomal subunit protein eL14z-like n=1 Tax=Bidens hawaiensis TaxID=980011 RepID=UPI00404AE9E4
MAGGRPVSAAINAPALLGSPSRRQSKLIALVNYGKDYGKLVVIVDVIDQNRALVDSPDMVRGQMNFKRLTLTDIKIDIKRVPNKKTLIAAMEAADVKNKWENSSWGRKFIVQKKRASLNDFDRFKIMLAKIKVK